MAEKFVPYPTDAASLNGPKPLDFVRTPLGAFAIITETHHGQYHHTDSDGVRLYHNLDMWAASIRFIGPGNEKISWWNEEDGLEVLDSLPRVLAMSYHPFGEGERDAVVHFGIRPVTPTGS